jgi:tRNA(fMet)-specific endonuclease VapC
LRGYLLDTCVVTFWHNPNLPENASIVSQIHSLDPGTPLRISAITWGEIEYGHRCVSRTESSVQAQFKAFLRRNLPRVLDVRQTTALYYAEVRAALFGKFAPARRKKSLRPEQLVDPLSSAELGIQENDLWIAAQAMEHNLVLVTHEKMARIKDVAKDLSNLVDFEDWVA